MNPSILLSPPSSSQSRPLLLLPFTPNSFPTTRRRFRVALPRNSLSTTTTDDSQTEETPNKNIFGDLTGIQTLVHNLSPPVRLVTSAALVAGALASGYRLGLQFGANRSAAFGGAAAAGGAAAYAVNAAVPGVAADNALRNILGLGNKEAEAIIKLDVTSKVYHKRLSEAFHSGDLEMADSKATFLQSLCEQLHFDPQKATEIHQDIYRKRLQQCVADGELDESDVAALLKVRVMLCVPQQIVDAAHSDICGSLFEKAVKEAISSGVDGYDADVKNAVRKAAHGLRLSSEVAMDIAGKAVREVFFNYVKRSQLAGNHTVSARELEKMIANTLVVTQLLADIKGEPSDAPSEEPVKEEVKQVDEDYERESLQSLRKIRPNRELIAKLGKPGQTEITLKDGLSDKDRMGLYKTYLLYCLTGGVTRIPFGAQITTKKDDSEYLLLNQLGGILGLTSEETVEIHRGFAEQAFRQQAEVILADGQLTKARIEQLNELQKNVGLPGPYAQKIIKSITTTKMLAAIETAIAHERLNIKQIRELIELGVDLDMISESFRENIFKKIVNEIFSSGTGEFDEEEVYEKIPADLKVNPQKAKEVVHDLARTRLSNSLIQAVSLLRQRNQQAAAVSSLNDLLACDKAVPSEPLSWEVPEELADLFAVYARSNPAPENLSRLQYLLNINDL